MNGLWKLAMAAWIFCFGIQIALPAYAEESSDAEESGIVIDTSDDLVYDVFTYHQTDDGSGIVITSCDTAASQIEIPTEIDGVPVTEIGDAAFMSCNFLTTIQIPEGIEVIGESAFASCSILYEVTLPESLQKIGPGAFESCTTLLSIEIPSSVTTLPDALFYGCSVLGNVTLPDTLQSIGNETFYSCTGLTEFTLPKSLTSIGDYAFQNCQKLTGISIPAACSQIGSYAFDGCQALTEIMVAPDNPAYASQDGVLFTKDGSVLIRYPQAYAQTNYTIPETCTKLENWSFIGSTALQTIDLNQVTEIGEDCFYYCTSLASITIPEGVTILDGAVFAYCMALTEITLPSTLEAIGDHCFYACTALESVTVPEGVTTIGEQCFYNCAALKEISLPSTITEVGDMALGYYDSSETSQMERMDQLVIRNGGSDAVRDYLNQWEHGDSSFAVWLIVGGAVVILAAGVTTLVLIRRNRNRIRPTSRHAPEHNTHGSAKKHQKR